MRYADDAPLFSPQDDQFGLAPFGRRLTRILRAAQEGQNVVVGLNGAWGSGKTTAINFSIVYLMAVETAGLDPFAKDEQAEQRALEQFLEQHGSDMDALLRAERARGAAPNETVILRYNPWLVSGHETLVSDFFRLVGNRAADFAQDHNFKKLLRQSALRVAHLTEGASGAASVFFDYAALTALMADPTGATSAGAKASGWLAKKAGNISRGIRGRLEDTAPLTLEEARDELRLNLRKVGRRFVVVIDDIDRLEPAEVRPMLSMVKSVGQLPNVRADPGSLDS